MKYKPKYVYGISYGEVARKHFSRTVILLCSE